jgi:hypothetical protein
MIQPAHPENASTRFTAPLPASLAMAVDGNCAFSALIDPHDRVAWCCLPRCGGNPGFYALLQGDAPPPPDHPPSAFSTEIEDSANACQWYEPHTAVLRTQLSERRGEGIDITDFAPCFVGHARFFRLTTLARRVKPMSGASRIRVSVDVCREFWRQQPGRPRAAGDRWSASSTRLCAFPRLGTRRYEHPRG